MPPSEHGADLDAYMAFNREAMGEGTMTEPVRKAIQLAWGRFIIHDDPTLSHDIVASLTMSADGTTTGDDISAIASGSWTEWFADGTQGYRMLNINMTGGVPKVISWTPVGGTAINVTQMVDPGLGGQFRMVDATNWEGGRGRRCDLWRNLGPAVPEK